MTNGPGYGDTATLETAIEPGPRPAAAPGGVWQTLEDASDLLSPIVVKEVRQFVRGREFTWTFFASLAAGLLVAFIAAASASGDIGGSGRWVFNALTACLGIVGCLVVPLGAFSALRNEHLEQTLDLITVTTLSPLRVVTGKLLAQAVKLTTLFAGMAPFVAMSFLLGGIDFGTIVVTLALVFLVSLWICAVAIFLSSLTRTRALSGVLFAGLGVALLIALGATRLLYLALTTLPVAITASGGVGLAGPGFSPVASAGATWWMAGGVAVLGAASLVNVVLLAENRLSSPVDDKATALRIGFFAQFLLMAAFCVVIWLTVPAVLSVAPALAILCGTHLALVAAFTVTEDFVVSRRAWLRAAASPWRWLNPIVRPGGGRGALYVLAQMALLLAVLWGVDASLLDLRWAAALCGFICFFTAVPTVLFRALAPRLRSFHLRVAILVLLSAAMVLPDLAYYLVWRPDVFTFAFDSRHLVNPLRTLGNWATVETRQMTLVPLLLGSLGLAAYLALIWMNRSVARSAPLGPPAHGDTSHAVARLR